jgi:uncharacterized protein YdiU (UPF0061 family)
LLHANVEVASLLGLSERALGTQDFLDVCAGNRPLNGGCTLSAVYSGHQFGVWAGQLGDGRAHLLGEVVAPSGSWELQLKGSGHTPYSRMGDGRAVVRSSVREYLASEAMAGLGIPTTRALALVVSDDPVYRETVETAAILTRVAPSFVRFGSFEHWWNDPVNMQVLLDYVIDRFYPQCRTDDAGNALAPADAALRFLEIVTVRTAELIAAWLSVGFCHGVMNTDNMSILGLTMDYGPYGFMDGFQVNHICNHTDTQGRYAWNAQPSVANWNLYRLANCLMALGLDSEALKARLDAFEPAFLKAYQARMAGKFGWSAWKSGDETLVDDWWGLLHAQRADFTLSFRRLARVHEDPEPFLSLFGDRQPALDWLAKYRGRLDVDSMPAGERAVRMDEVNPLYVLRNHLAELAIRAAQHGDAREIRTLLDLLRDPYTEKPGFEDYAAPAPEWACGLEVSCSS